MTSAYSQIVSLCSSLRQRHQDQHQGVYDEDLHPERKRRRRLSTPGGAPGGGGISSCSSSSGVRSCSDASDDDEDEEAEYLLNGYQSKVGLLKGAVLELKDLLRSFQGEGSSSCAGCNRGLKNGDLASEARAAEEDFQKAVAASKQAEVSLRKKEEEIRELQTKVRA